MARAIYRSSSARLNEKLILLMVFDAVPPPAVEA
jgi:hypothetical protein